MAKIPTYQGIRVNAPQVPASFAGMEASGFEAIGQGLTALGTGIAAYERRKEAKAKEAQDKKDLDEAKVYSARVLSSLRERMSFEEKELQGKVPPGAEGYTPQYLQMYDRFTEEIIQGSPNNLAKQYLTERTAELRGQYADEAITFEASAAQFQREKDLLDSTRRSANYLRTHPLSFDQILEEQMLAASAVTDKLPPQEQEKVTWQIRNTLATSAIEGEIETSPAAAEKRIRAGTWDDLITPDQKSAFLKAAESKRETTSAVYQYKVSRMVDNHLASIEETGLGIPGVSAAMVAGAFGGGDRGQVAALKFQDAERVAGKVHSARIEVESRQSPEERAETLRRYAPDRVGRPDTFAEDREVFTKVQTALVQDMDLQVKDPAAWADKNGAVTNTARDTGIVSAVDTSLVIQARSGIEPHNTRVATQDAAKTIVGRLDAATPIQKMELLTGLEQEYGRHFPKLMTELLSAGMSSDYMVIYNVQKTNPAVAALLSQSIGTKATEVKERYTASGKGTWSTVMANVEGRFSPLEKAATYAFPQRRAEFNSIMDLYARTAANLVLSGRYNSVQDASEFLFNESYGGMHVSDTFYLPATLEDGTPLNGDRAASELRRLLKSSDWVATRKLDTNASAGMGLLGSTRQAIDANMLKYQGIWVNSADGKSLELFLNRKSGMSRVYETVPTSRGGTVRRPVVVSLEDVANGKIKSGFSFPGENWSPPGVIESLGTPGFQ